MNETCIKILDAMSTALPGFWLFKLLLFISLEFIKLNLFLIHSNQM